MPNQYKLKNNIIICGHFGCGKTNVAVGLALAMAKSGKKLGILDLDIVNPYFRTADSVPKLKKAGIDCYIPEFANTNVDIPSLGSEISSVFARQDTDPSYSAIFDLGGDNGAVALGRFRADLIKRGYTMIFVTSMYRPLISTPENAVNDLYEIEQSARLRVTAIINNSNIGRETTTEDIIASLSYAEKISELTSIPLLTTTLHSEKSAEILRKSYPDKTFFVIPDSTRKLF